MGANDNASTAGNWSDGVPTNTHHFLLDGTANKNLTWDAGAWLFLQATPGETNIWTGGSNTVWSTADNWSLDVSGYRSVQGVDVKDSDASSGLPIPAASSASRGGNVNWTFDGAGSVWGWERAASISM